MSPPAATAAILTPERTGDYAALGVKAAMTIHAGTIVAIDGDGWAVPASKTAGLTVIGRAENSVANTSTGAADGDLIARVKRRGVFRWSKSATNAPTRAHVGDDAYAEDDQTVGTSAAGNAPKAGVFVAVDDGGAWVEV